MLARRNAPFWLLLTALLLLALNLRAPIVALAPVMGQVQEGLGVSAATAGLLTSVPALCFALLTPFTSVFIGRAGPERAIAATVCGVFLGTLLRSAGGAELAFAGMALIGVALTIGNIAVPVIVNRDVPRERIGLVMGAYVAALNAGTMIVTLGTAPLADVIGWRAAIAAWAVVALLSAIVWTPAFGWGGKSASADARPSPPGAAVSAATGEDSSASAGVGPYRRSTPKFPPTWKSLTGWLLALGFGAQSFSYYAFSAWLPTLLGEEIGMSTVQAGSASSLFQALALIGALGAPVLMRVLGGTSAAVVTTAFWLAVPLGLLLLPSAWVLWLCLGGIAQAAAYTVMLTVIAQISRSGAQAASYSAFMHTAGYAVSIFGPPALGALHAATGTWTAPLALELGILIVLGASLIAATLRQR